MPGTISSIQVHPTTQPQKPVITPMKTEMWYLVGADRDAELIMGFKKIPTNRNTLLPCTIIHCLFC
ncbi:hypothetical protein [Odoribacter laneus]|uniref:hypothetical protein n=1 Tax=Odoribacter laneus TaxID=626933 RepID=UPI00399648AF